MAAKKQIKRRKSPTKTYKCTDCSWKGQSPQGLGAHKRQTGHMGGTAKSNGHKGDVTKLVSDALKAVDSQMKSDRKILVKIRDMLVEYLDE